MGNEEQSAFMYYRKTGNGPAIMLLHGFPDSGAIWCDIADELAANYTVIDPDLPGAGHSSLLKETLLPEMADGLKQILDHEGMKKVLVVGHSMGGYTALAFARKYPEVVAGLSLVHSTAAADDEEKKKTRQKAIELIRNGGKEAFVKQMTGNLFSLGFRADQPDVVRIKAEAGMKMSAEGMVNFYAAMIAREDNTEVLRKAVFPLHWVMGIEDSVINYKKNLAECHHSLVNFVTLYEDCGHMSMLECPARLLLDIRQFCAYCYYNPLTE